MFFRMVIAATVAGLSTFSGCQDDNNGSLLNDRATLYFHNQLTQFTGGSSDDVTVNLFVDDLNTALRSGEVYSTTGSVSSDSVKLADSADTLAFDVTGKAGSTLISGPVNFRLTQGEGYTLVLMGDTSLDNRQLKLFRQVSQTVSSSQASIRFINTLSQLDPDQLSVAQGSNTLVEKLDYGVASSYVTLTGSGNLSFTINDQTQGLALDTVSCNLSAGRSYDAIIAYRQFDSQDDDLALYCQPVAR
ncbi:MAG: hypothetical protein R3292_00260 [Alcanivorax sp.]|nr:hypothetical protein [Alcanivorax sp.]